MADQLLELGSVTFGKTLARGSAAFVKSLAIGDEVFGETLALGSVDTILSEVNSINAPDFAGVQRYEWSADNLDLTDGDPVETWADVGGSGVDISQTTLSKRPTYRASVGGYPAVDFDGVDDILEATGLSLDWSTGIHAFMVFQVLSYNFNNGWLILDDGASSNSDDGITLYMTSGTGGSINLVFIRRDPSVRFAQTPNAFAIGLDQMATFTGNTTSGDGEVYDGRTNLSLVTDSYVVPAAPHSRIALGAGNGESNGRLHLRAMVIYDADLSIPQRESVWDNLETRFGGPF